MRILALLLAVLALTPSACGSGDDGGEEARTTTSGTSALSADDVEQALSAEFGTDSGVVDLGGEPPRLVNCERSSSVSEWECRVSSQKGRSFLCKVVTNPSTGMIRQRVCAPVDY